MKSLEKRLEELKDPHIRMEFVESLQNQLSRHADLTRSSFTALDCLIDKFANKKLSKNIAIVKAEYNRKAKSHNNNLFGKPIQSYELRVFGDLYVLESASAPGIDVDVTVTIFRNNIAFHYFYDEELKTKKYEHGDFFYCNYIAAEDFKRSEGAAIKKLAKNGKIKIGGKPYNMGVQNGKNNVLLLFNKGEVYFFDFNGEMLFRTLNIEEIMEKKKLQNMYEIKRRMDDFDVDDYCRRMIAKGPMAWALFPEASKIATNLIINGEVKYSTNNEGYLALPVNSFDGKPCRRRVSNRLEEVKVEVKGPYIAVWDVEEELLNAYFFKGPLWYKTLKADGDFNTVSLKTLNLRALDVRIRNTSYFFSKTAVVQRLGRQPKDSEKVGLMFMLNNGEPSFELLIKGEELIKEKIEPIRVYVHKK